MCSPKVITVIVFVGLHHQESIDQKHLEIETFDKAALIAQNSYDSPIPQW